MSRIIILIILGTIIGLAIGYAVFAQAGGGYIPLKRFVSINSNQNPETLKGVVQSLGNSLEDALLNMKTRRRSIIIAGLAGGLAGALAGAFSLRRRGNR